MINKLQSVMLEMPQVDIETTHTFCNGVYAREIKFRQGVGLVGAKHKTSFFMVISKGRCNINGNTYEAPCTLVSEIGAKRAIVALEDTVLTTFHRTNETDVAKIEKAIIEPEGLRIVNNPQELIK